ncbi:MULTISPECIES: phosphodiester glycosidase family protein [Bacteroides]|uniref:phosphodiester glycosidase family protein n=1 Tax=Bacteroides TaxID=816 RepID=UPI0008217617|nr:MULTISPECIES: phosphodiester glycosidase family protein [Bacteroides]SCG95430.1 Exopolysaccharide biosynthesis protein related to N-acetylglucosamine-1-phosphodiester alpha-N-acetylglucosaminidase [uncultured Bacteroides sp.]
MKKLIYDSALLLLGCLLWTACNNDEDLTVFSTEGAKTELGQKIIAGSDGYVGQYFSDSTYTLAPGVQALEMKILSATGLAVKMFVLEVDLKEAHLTMKASSPNEEGKLKTKQQMTLQALAYDKPGSRVLAAVNGDFFAKDGTPQGIYYRNGTCLKGTMTDNVCTFFAITKNKKAIIGSYDEYDSYKEDIQEAVGGRVRLMTNGNVLPQTVTALEPRTAIGVTDDNVVYILVADGRNFWYSNGMRYAEMGAVMKALGAKNAINLDGGGSSTFIIRKIAGFEDGRFAIRNWPYDNGGVEREVANGLLVVTDN